MQDATTPLTKEGVSTRTLTLPLIELFRLICGLPLLGFYLFLHVEILTLCVVELILQEGELL